MISNFSDRLERQVEIRLKALGQIEILNAKQNEILSELESMKNSQESVQKNAEINRNEIARMERTTGEMNQKVIDIQIQTRNSEETTRNTLQQVQNHRAEFRLIRAELKQAIDTMNVLLQNVERSQNLLDNGAPSMAGNETLENLLEEKQKEIENLEQSILANQPGNAEEDAAVVLNLLRAQKQELSRAAADARTYLQDQFLKGTENPSASTENRADEKVL
jgi:chromosome segregation ATPase